MQWTQYRFEDGRHLGQPRFKCNRCGITTLVDPGETLPPGWSVDSPGWHVCPSCQAGPRRGRAVLPIIG